MKVGKEYIKEGEVRKRPLSGIVWTTVWLVLSLGWIAFEITLGLVKGFPTALSKDTFAMVFICNIPLFIFVLGFGVLIKYSCQTRLVEFRIHEYERWNWKESKYEKFFVTETVYLRETYFYGWHTGDHLDVMDDKELEEYCKGLPGDYSTFVGYETQEEAMLNIINDIKRLIADDKAVENIKIRNVKTVETFSVDDLKQKVAEGKFKNNNKK